MLLRVKINKTLFGRKYAWSLFILPMLLFAAFFVSVNKAQAGGTGFENIRFNIDTELDVINNQGVTVIFKCNGTGQGSVTDGVASDSAADGVITISSTSAEFGNGESGCDSGETITATVSLGGWVSRTWTATVAASTSDGTANPFITRASMDYAITINGVADELSNTLTLDGTTASATYSGTVASQSYSNYSGSYKKYIAGSTSGGTVTGGANGYVNRVSSAVTVSATASQSVDFGTSDDSGIDASGLSFGHKVHAYLRGGSSTADAINVGTVTAGDSYGTSCTVGTGSNLSYWYCAIPIANTETSARFVHDNYNTETATYTDRDDGNDAQVATDILPTAKAPSGGGCTYCSSPIEETPTPTPEVSVTPTPSVSATPTPSVSATPAVTAAKLYRKVSDPKVYVQVADGTLTWVKTLEEFNSAGYKWSDVQVISGSEFAKLKVESVSAAKLYRKTGDPKVYVQSADGKLSWVKTLEAFNAAGYNWTDVKAVSESEFNQMSMGGKVKVVSNIGYLNVRASAAISGKLLTKVLSGQEFEFSAISNGWYKIWKNGKELGWVSGKYVTEI